MAPWSLAGVRRLSSGVRAGTVLVACGAVALVVLAVRFPEWPGPRGLADRRTLLGIPNALDVLSNLPFALAGALGLARLGAVAPRLRPAAATFFLSVLGVTFGSGLYHLEPSVARLLLDRLPITLAFTSLFALVLGDRVSPRLARVALAPLLALGVAAALLWYFGGDTRGAGEFRPYALVQALPMAALPLVLLLWPGELDERRFALAFAFYGAAKLAELYDHELFAALRVVSGHTLKHLFAASACVFLAPRKPARPST